ncbi:MAG: endonuclease domain-containing protein [Clostridiales bacterium]|nr:endonuclease domain-containing protein [Clostridiales bacterium]
MSDTKPQYTGYNPKLKNNARKLRKNMTPEERHLWYDFLRFYPVKIYRQRAIDNYIVDFYCSLAKLVIEVDGSQHYTTEGIKYDSIRTEVLRQYGLEVIRFTNRDIRLNFQSVCDAIDSKIRYNMSMEE